MRECVYACMCACVCVVVVVVGVVCVAPDGCTSAGCCASSGSSDSMCITPALANAHWEKRPLADELGER